MNPLQLDQASAAFKALGEPVRLRLFALLTVKEELCVCHLTEALQLPQSTVSRHLTLWIFLSIITGIGLGSLSPASFQAIGALEVAHINMPVAVLIWVMILPMLLKIYFSSLHEVWHQRRGIAVTLGDCHSGCAYCIIQVYATFGLAYLLNRKLSVQHSVAAPSALIGASNFFELAVATAIALFGFESGAALATVVGVLVEVPVMLTLVSIINRSKGWYESGIKVGNR